MDDFGNALHFTDVWRSYNLGYYGWCAGLAGMLDFNDLIEE